MAMLLITITASSQNIPDSLYLYFYDFEVQRGNIKIESSTKMELDELKKEFIIYDLIDGLNTKDFGIYIFSLKDDTDYTSSHFLLVDNNKYSIYHIFSNNPLFLKILYAQDIAESTKKEWMRRIIQLSAFYSINHHKPLYTNYQNVDLINGQTFNDINEVNEDKYNIIMKLLYKKKPSIIKASDKSEPLLPKEYLQKKLQECTDSIQIKRHSNIL